MAGMLDADLYKSSDRLIHNISQNGILQSKPSLGDYVSSSENDKSWSQNQNRRQNLDSSGSYKVGQQRGGHDRLESA